jgi:hypothetical protein
MQVAFATRPASAASPNEDFIGATPQTIVVLDGASVPPGMKTGCQHGTPWYVTQLGAAMLHRSLTRPDQTLTDMLAEAIEEVSTLHADRCDLGDPGTPSAAVALLRERPDAVEHLVLADCTIVLDRSSGIEAISDDRISHVAPTERAALRQYPTSASPRHAEPLSRLVSAQRERRNRPGGFWVASNDPSAAHEAIVGSTPREQLRRAAVMSDGAACLVDHFHIATWSEALAVLDHQGPSPFIDRVRDAEASDREGKPWRRSKQHDDATIAICRFQAEL